MTLGPEKELMMPADVAELFRVSAKTIARWSREGKLAAVRTAGGHRRFRREDVEALQEELDEKYEVD